MRHRAQLGQHHAADAADAHVQALQVGDRLDFLAVPAAHLHAHVATDVIDDVVLLIERAQHRHAAAVVDPGVVLAGAQPEGQAGVEGQRRVLADIGGAQHVIAFDRAIADRIHVLRRRHQLAARKGADLELAFGQLRHALAEVFGRTVDGVQALGPAGGHAPAHRRRGLRDGWHAHGRRPAPAAPAACARKRRRCIDCSRSGSIESPWTRFYSCQRRARATKNVSTLNFWSAY